MGVSLRTPRTADADQIAALHVSTWREAYAHLLPESFFTPEYIAGRERMWRDVLGHPRERVRIRVAECEGVMVGFAWVGPALPREDPALAQTPQLYAIYVAAAHYGVGVGQRLLEDALGDGPAFLWVAQRNPRAIAFYRRNGFRFDGAQQSDAHGPIVEARMVREGGRE